MNSVSIVDSYLEGYASKLYTVMLSNGRYSVMAIKVPGWKSLEPHLLENQEALNNLFINWKHDAECGRSNRFVMEILNNESR